METIKNLDKTIKALTEKQNYIAHTYTESLLRVLGNEAAETANNNFNSAQYDGNNTVHCSCRLYKKKNLKAKVTAYGAPVLFIEFGTGVTYPDDHPMMATMGYTRGTYGKGLGSNSEWIYHGVAGTNGRVIGRDGDGNDIVATKGNPANRCMYNAWKQVQINFPHYCEGSKALLGAMIDD